MPGNPLISVSGDLFADDESDVGVDIRRFGVEEVFVEAVR